LQARNLGYKASKQDYFCFGDEINDYCFLTRSLICLISLNQQVRILLTVRQKLVLEDESETMSNEKIQRNTERFDSKFFEVELQRLKQQDGVNLFKACCRRPTTVRFFSCFWN
jgi:hypothetical protein